MKSLIILLALAIHSIAADVGLKWNPNPAEDQVTRYEVTFHTGPGTEPTVINVPAPDVRVTITGLTPGTTYFFTVRAANADGISEPSDELAYRVPKPPAKPTGLQVVEIQVSTNLTDWETIALVPLKTAAPTRHIRAGLTTIPQP